MVRKVGICLVTIAVFVATGCFGEQCECENGRYQAIYTKLDGTCGVTPFYNIPIEYRYSQIGKWSLIEDNYNYTNSTQIGYQGCAMSLMHEVKVTNQDTLTEAVIFRIQGQVDIEGPTQLSGRVYRVEYDRHNKSVACEGNYDVVLRKTAELRIE